MDFERITLDYYARFLGIGPGELGRPGLVLCPSALRDTAMPGYPEPWDIYLFCLPGQVVVSYVSRAAGKVGQLAGMLTAESTAEEAAKALERVYGKEPNRGLKFIFRGLAGELGGARPLTGEDAPLFVQFFREATGAAQTDWVEEYFLEIAEKGYTFGVEEEGMLLSATDAPDMPFLGDKVQEIGIRTLPAARGKGYASQACAACAQAMVEKGICPMWSTSADNMASQRLAYRVGFEKLADTLAVTL